MTRLHLTLLTSLALHAMGLVALGATAPQLSGQMHSSLSVQLVGSDKSVDHTQATQAAATRQAARQPVAQQAAQVMLAPAEQDVAHVIADARNTNPPPLATAATTTMSTPASDNASSAGDPQADTVNRIKAYLYTDLAQHFDYPEMARRRGWEGRVMLAMNVASDGQLQQIRVARSSGFAILDNSALQSLRQVDRIAEAGTLLNGRRLAMQIPVIYRLQGEP